MEVLTKTIKWTKSTLKMMVEIGKMRRENAMERREKLNTTAKA